MKKVNKRVSQVGVYGPHTQGIFKAFIFGTCTKNILIYSQMRFELHQTHSMTAIGLESGKKANKLGN